MKRWLPHLGVLLGLGIGLYALFFSSTDQDLIRNQLNLLEDSLAVSANENNMLVRQARVKAAFSQLFVKQVSVEITELPDIRSKRSELVKRASYVIQFYRTATVDLSDLTIDIDTAGMTGVAYGEVLLQGTRHDGELARETRTCSIRLDKIEGTWRIVGLSVSKPNPDGKLH